MPTGDCQFPDRIWRSAQSGLRGETCLALVFMRTCEPCKQVLTSERRAQAGCNIVVKQSLYPIVLLRQDIETRIRAMSTEDKVVESALPY
jgi:hypothetical protein